MKKLVITLVLLFVMAPICFSAPFVYDGEELLTDSQSERLNEELSEIYSDYDVSVIIVTVADDEESEAAFQKKAHSFYDSGDFGDNGILLMVNTVSRMHAFSVNGVANDIFKSSVLDGIEEDLVGYLSEDEYSDAFECFSRECERAVKKYLDNGNSENDDMTVGDCILISVVLGLIIGFVTVCVMKSKLKSVRSRTNAEEYVKDGSLNVTCGYEKFLWRLSLIHI